MVIIIIIGKYISYPTTDTKIVHIIGQEAPNKGGTNCTCMLIRKGIAYTYVEFNYDEMSQQYSEPSAPISYVLLNEFLSQVLLEINYVRKFHRVISMRKCIPCQALV